MPPSRRSRLAKEIEAILGGPLFQRRGRRMDLSLEGRQLVEKAEPLLGMLNELLLPLDEPSAAVGLIRIGLGEIIARTWFPQFLREAMRAMPNLRFDVKIDLNIPRRQDLENGKLDIALLGDSAPTRKLTSAPLGKLRIQWVASPILVSPGPITEPLSELLTRYPIWSLSKASMVYPHLRAELNSLRTRVNFNVCDNISAMISLVTAGAGIGLLPEVLVREQIERGELLSLGDDASGASISFFATCRAEERQVAVLKLVELAQKISTFR